MGTVEQRGSVSWWQQRRFVQGLSITWFLEVKGLVPPLVFCGDRVPLPRCRCGAGAGVCSTADAAVTAQGEKGCRWSRLDGSVVPALTRLALWEGRDVSPWFQLHLNQ